MKIRKFVGRGAVLLLCVAARPASATAPTAMREAEAEVEAGLDAKSLPEARSEKYSALLQVYEEARSEAVKVEFGDGSLIFYPSDDPLQFIDAQVLLENPGLAELLIMTPEGVGLRKSNEFVDAGSKVKMVGGEDGVVPPVQASTLSRRRGSTTGAFIDPDGVPIDQPQQGTVAWNGYVRITTSHDYSPFGSCSGVLIAPNLVLTAAHCTREVPPEVQIGGTCDEWFLAENRYKVIGCRIHDKAVPSIYLGNREPGDCGIGPHTPIRTRHDLAILRLERPVPPDRATPRSLLLSAAPDQIADQLTMFGYGYTAHLGSNSPDCGHLGAGLVVLAKARQRMRALVKNRDPAELSVTALPPADFTPSGVYGAVCGDSGGPLTMTVGAKRRELVIGVLSTGNRTDGGALAVALYQDKNREFILSVTGRQPTELDGLGAVVYRRQIAADPARRLHGYGDFYRRWISVRDNRGGIHAEASGWGGDYLLFHRGDYAGINDRVAR